MGMTKLHYGLVAGLILSAGSAVALWGADTTPTETAPATTTAASSANTVEARVHCNKAYDLYNQKKYQQAAEENNAALTLDPDYRNAQLLKSLIDPNLTGGGAVVTAGNVNHTLLTKDEISRIRLNEINPDIDLKTIKGVIPRKDVEDFWKEVILKDPAQTDTSKAAHDKFVQPDNLGLQIKAMKDAQAIKYYDHVKLNSDPADMVTFRQLVHPFVMNNCATANCHDSKNNRGLPLVALAGRNPTDVAYTNFYILNSLTYNGHPMIDRNNPADSLLIQFATDPKSGVAIPHPGNKPVPHHFTNTTTDPMAVKIAAWIGSLTFAPNYGINYQIPARPAPAPAASAPAGAAVNP